VWCQKIANVPLQVAHERKVIRAVSEHQLGGPSLAVVRTKQQRAQASNEARIQVETSTTDTAVPTEDALAAFFTPERLTYYRKLHRRYPLWCGGWPEPEISKPDGDRWLLETRLNEAARQFVPKGRLFYVDFSEKPTSDRVPLPALLFAGPGGGRTQSLQPDPLAGSALLAAIYYTWAQWRSGDVGPANLGGFWAEPAYSQADLLRVWGTSLDLLLRTPESYLGVRESQGPNGISLSMLRRRFLAATDKSAREQRREDLHQYWSQIGQTVGILPGVPGGPKCTLSKKLIAHLIEEGENLVRAINGYVPDDEERDAVRCLLPWERHDPYGRVVELERRHPDVAMRRRRNWDPKLGTENWIFRLRFPMLSAAELRDIRQGWRTGQNRSTRHRRLAVELLADRLPIGESQINKLAAQIRK